MGASEVFLPYCGVYMRKMGFNGFKTQMESRTRSVSSGLGSSTGLRGKTSKSSYKDQIRKEQLRRAARPQSALSFSQINSRTSCPSAQQYDDRPYLCSRSSIISSSKFNSSFNNKDIVYPSKKVGAHYSRPSSEMKYRSPEGFHRKQSTFSLGAVRDQDCYKAFQDPVKKTYGGDLLQKHSQHFTQAKPFTPKTLKSDKSSYLSKYRYYRAPKIKSSQDGSNWMQQEMCEQSTENKESTQEFDEPSQECSAAHEWVGDKDNHTDPYLFSSLSRAVPEDTTPPSRSGISAEEEELMYLEFISAVTEDILSKAHISDSIIDRVMNRHIDMNLHRLDEGKMCHLLEVLRKEFEQPASTEPPKELNDLSHPVFLHLQSGWEHVKTEEDRNGLTQYGDLLLDSALLSLPVRTFPSAKTDEKEEEGDTDEKETGSTLISEDAASNEDGNQESVLQVDTTAVNIPDDNYVHTRIDGDQKQADIQKDGESEELEYLERTLSEVLHVSSNTQSEDVETANGPHTNSDDEF
ncbi:transcript variant X4 [Nothobranchius furzeri]|uniref:Transcript variant X4 n=1 Tax=Nothobranchius furzeri TaxID=105023 RepID=A0A9D2XG35_NOTFU|nr:transcript variant X4 [Nothobranchius furzeri]